VRSGERGNPTVRGNRRRRNPSTRERSAAAAEAAGREVTGPGDARGAFSLALRMYRRNERCVASETEGNPETNWTDTSADESLVHNTLIDRGVPETRPRGEVPG